MRGCDARRGTARVACTALTLAAAMVAVASGDLPAQSWRRGGPGRVFKATIRPHWHAGGDRFWYRNDLRDGAREYVAVDAVRGVREPAFDHDRLAAALREAGVEGARPRRLGVERLELDAETATCVFRAGGEDWRCDLDSYRLTRVADRPTGTGTDGLPSLAGRDAPRASTRTGPETSVTFVNRTAGEVEIRWVATDGNRRSYGRIEAGGERDQHTYAGHVWEVVDSEGRVLAVFQATDSPERAVVPQEGAARERRRPGAGADRPRSRFRPGPTSRGRGGSPDGQWTATVRDHDLYLRAKEGDEVRLTDDGSEENAYSRFEWSPDSRVLVAFRVRPGEEKEVHLIESSPRGGGRARLRSRPYALPGDRFTTYELHLFDVATGKRVRTDVEPIDFGRPRLRWNADGRRFTYEKVDRGHQRFRLIEVDSHTGSSRNVIDEKTDTFIWTAHTESVRVRRLTWLETTDEIVYASERDGWRHLYLVDVEAGKIAHRITRGELVVRAIDRIDEASRQIWFQASGGHPGQDPYLIHHYRVGFDGSDLTALTAGHGSHTIQRSPDGRFLIDTYSRVDQAPVHELRRASDGKKVCDLETADDSLLRESGWEPPEVFVAKGRDGKTDIWGIICRPRDLDPSRKYPILEDVYAGPQSAYVPKTFRASSRYASWTRLGFVVVKIDGMGTAHRSKAFHDVCWKNLADAGLPDRILWIRAAAEKYPYLDIDRVGIYGTSAGGQNAAGAVLFHPEFYKAAVASSGCHDNRMDKASWNEQWMGYPVGPHYAACSNIENAHRLQGHLMLIVGELDNNVPPESTMRFVDALIRARKDFDLIVVPGAGHGSGGSYGQRRMQDFFVRHLQGIEPPNRNAPSGGG